MAETPEQIIRRVAAELGVDPELAVAIARQESGLNPRAVGDSGHSVGLFQLHDAGEGAGMGDARYDPERNARTALSVVAQVAAAHPDWSPGQIAVAAQRPREDLRPGYVASVNRMMGIGAGGGGTGSGSGRGGSPVAEPKRQYATLAEYRQLLEPIQDLQEQLARAQTKVSTPPTPEAAGGESGAVTDAGAAAAQVPSLRQQIAQAQAALRSWAAALPPAQQTAIGQYDQAQSARDALDQAVSRAQAARAALGPAPRNADDPSQVSIWRTRVGEANAAVTRAQTALAAHDKSIRELETTVAKADDAANKAAASSAAAAAKADKGTWVQAGGRSVLVGPDGQVIQEIAHTATPREPADHGPQKTPAQIAAESAAAVAREQAQAEEARARAGATRTAEQVAAESAATVAHEQAATEAEKYKNQRPALITQLRQQMAAGSLTAADATRQLQDYDELAKTTAERLQEQAQAELRRHNQEQEAVARSQQQQGIAALADELGQRQQAGAIFFNRGNPAAQQAAMQVPGAPEDSVGMRLLKRLMPQLFAPGGMVTPAQAAAPATSLPVPSAAPAPLPQRAVDLAASGRPGYAQNELIGPGGETAGLVGEPYAIGGGFTAPVPPVNAEEEQTGFQAPALAPAA